MSDVRLLVWHLIAGPIAGAIVGATAYALWLRPLLPWPAWVLDLAASLFGTVGLLAGGVLLFRLPPAPVPAAGRESAAAGAEGHRRMPIRAFGLSTGALIVAVSVAGVPVLTWPAFAAVVVCGVVAGAVLRHRV